MDKTYWIGRKRAAMARSGGIRAAHPFLLPNKGPATPGEREALQLPARARPRPRSALGGPAEGGA